ncbi:MAG TPA: hypothetical protein VFD70_30905 [Anaerolineae bacterium]|nr:hypothetical protein [Anaerolineae bacterium]
MSQSLVSQIQAAIEQASSKMAEARKRKDDAAYEFFKVQRDALKGQLKRAQRGVYASLESGN